jgi:hypothetical protein
LDEGVILTAYGVPVGNLEEKLKFPSAVTVISSPPFFIKTLPPGTIPRTDPPKIYSDEVLNNRNKEKNSKGFRDRFGREQKLNERSRIRE